MPTEAFVITISGDKESFRQADVLIDSSAAVKNNFSITKFLATTPDNVVKTFTDNCIRWNYPWTKSVLDIQSGMIKEPYRTADPKKRMACFASHYRLWTHSVKENINVLVFEHDAQFIRHFDLSELDNSPYSVVSLNDPRGATRRSQMYYNMTEGHEIAPAPWIDDHQVPQGLPGNSAYFITPKGAKKLLDLTKEYGAWPNDALMCNQLMPKQLGCLGNYATIVQRTSKSSTSDD